ncbi:hypothetical protein SEMRO_731_G194360.1 [Seminavis robusta]|uniref:Uncharacterized protein n=1 Tax=Seminavis robusta TaxID=568900 RepID=A0A9N8EBV6_9STRA|nr:hypothetical protein SEMRO_731_G194360.1 [Seminavis robusta]|eukprot:Sro731_g194360.1 n/a (456) ;mRNA; r:48672-50039
MSDPPVRSNANSSSSRKRVNPYATKKTAPPELFQKPLEDYDDFIVEKEVDDWKQSSAAMPTNNTTNNTTNNNNTTTTNNNNNNHHPEDTDVAMPMSVSLPIWKRLPSNMISFGAAEILTISEIGRHGGLYSNANRPIRTTGVLRHRIHHGNSTEVSLVLEDPLAKLAVKERGGLQTPATTKAKKMKGRRISFGPTRTTSLLPKTPGTVAKTPSTTVVTTQPPQSTSTNRRPSLGMPRHNRTPLLVTPGGLKTPAASRSFQTPAASRPFQTPGGGLSSIRKKRPLSSVTKQRPQDVLATALTSHTVWIVVDPQHVPVDNLAVGDLVTVFGSIIQLQSGNEDNNTSQVPLSSFVREVATNLQQASSKPPQNNDASDKDKNNPCLFVQARILRQDNGANPRLHLEALKLRRKHLLETYHSSSSQKQQLQPGELLLGCGPPPYNSSRTQPPQEGDEMTI